MPLTLDPKTAAWTGSTTWRGTQPTVRLGSPDLRRGETHEAIVTSARATFDARWPDIEAAILRDIHAAYAASGASEGEPSSI